MTTTSQALVATDRPGRFGKQLCSHLGRRAQAAWDDGSGTGSIVFDGGTATCTLASRPDGLQLDLDAPTELLDRFEDVVGRHLVRFGAKDELAVDWVRADGSRGTSQRNHD